MSSATNLQPQGPSNRQNLAKGLALAQVPIHEVEAMRARLRKAWRALDYQQQLINLTLREVRRPSTFQSRALALGWL